MALARLMIACVVGWAAVACSGNTFLSSPDGNITVEHALSEEGVSVLRVSVHGDELIGILLTLFVPSALYAVASANPVS